MQCVHGGGQGNQRVGGICNLSPVPPAGNDLPLLAPSHILAAATTSPSRQQADSYCNAETHHVKLFLVVDI